MQNGTCLLSAEFAGSSNRTCTPAPGFVVVIYFGSPYIPRPQQLSSKALGPITHLSFSVKDKSAFGSKEVDVEVVTFSLAKKSRWYLN